MKKEDLIFDWRKSESSAKDKVLSVISVSLLFAVLLGTVELSLPEHPVDSVEQGTLIRLVDPEMARGWALAAEENRPFPGRLETGGKFAGAILSGQVGLSAWSRYEVKLRPLREARGVGRAEITPKGERVFPSVAAATTSGMPAASPVRSEPILIPYDATAREWIPAELPAFEMPAGAEVTPDSLRFAVSLREDGSVAEAIPLGGGADPAIMASEVWLRGVRFGKGTGERWFGLRVDFVNRRDDAARPE